MTNRRTTSAVIPDLFPLIAAGAALLTALAFYVYVRLNGLPFLLNLDDGYIHSRLAENFARFGRLGLNPGDGGGGSSSTPWTLLLAFCSFLSIPADKAAWVLSLTSFAVLGWVTARMATRVFGRTPARWVVTSLVVFSGQLAAMALSGMESLLFAVIIVLVFDELTARRLNRASVLAALAAFIRPEGVLISLSFVAVLLVRHEPKGTGSRSCVRDSARFLIPSLLAVVVSMLFLTAVSGQVPETLAARRWLIGLPPSPGNNWGLTFVAAYRLVLMMGRRMTDFVGPGHGFGLLWAIATLMLLLLGSWQALRGRITGRTLVLYLLLHCLFYFFLLPTPGHLGRYFVPLWVLGPFLVVIGWRRLAELLRYTRVYRMLPYLAAFLLAAYIPQLIRWAGWNRDTVEHLTTVHLAMARAVHDLVPPGETVGVFDVGLMSWVSEHRIMDIAGLTDGEVLKALQNRTVSKLLLRRHIRYIVLPEYEGRERWVLANMLALDPADLREVVRFTLGTRDLPHLLPTLVALPALGLYIWSVPQDPVFIGSP